jgi:phosphopantetheinyl transferase
MPATGSLPAAYRAASCSFTEADAVLARRPVGWPLSALETVRFDAFPTAKRRREWLAGRIAAKRLVGQDVEIANEPSGKPFCRMPDGSVGPEISIAHAAGMALCVLSEAGPVGVDCEPVAAKTAGTLALVATAEEQLSCHASPEAQTRLWCSKEAVLKLLGLGLTCDPTHVRVEAGNASLSGPALDRWKELGEPPIFLTERREARRMIVVAHTGGTHG